jgi:hypothetical protein
MLYSQLPLGIPTRRYLAGFLTKILHAFLISPILATCTTLLDFTILTILGDHEPLPLGFFEAMKIEEKNIYIYTRYQQ